LQRCIDAAREHGDGAIAYLPAGTYAISSTLQVTGADYAIEGTGVSTLLAWRGKPDQPGMRVTDPEGVRIAHLQMGGPAGAPRLLQVSKGDASSVRYDNLHFPRYSSKPGLVLHELPANARVRMGMIGGNVRIHDSGEATITGTIQLGRLVVDGAARPKSGIVGFLFHNAARQPYVVIVKDNQDLVVADLYHETSERFLLAEGGDRDEPGRITIGLSKSSALQADAVHIDNYGGRIWLSTGGWQNQKNRTEGKIVYRHEGERPLDLWLVANSYAFAIPEINAGPGLRVHQLANRRWHPEAARNLEDQVAPEALPRAAEALDHFRRLGQSSRGLNLR